MGECQQAYGRWPRENLSRAEILRRYTLIGMETLKNLSTQDRERLAHGFQTSQQTDDQHLRY